MKTIISMAVLLCLVITVNAQSLKVKRGTVTPDKVDMLDFNYHESDDLVYKSTDYAVYLNQTSPVTDTLYIYVIKEPAPQCNGTTLKGDRCRKKTRDLSGLCAVHKQ